MININNIEYNNVKDISYEISLTPNFKAYIFISFNEDENIDNLFDIFSKYRYQNIKILSDELPLSLYYIQGVFLEKNNNKIIFLLGKEKNINETN